MMGFIAECGGARASASVTLPLVISQAAQPQNNKKLSTSTGQTLFVSNSNGCGSFPSIEMAVFSG
jgi:hypothetical protein